MQIREEPTTKYCYQPDCLLYYLLVIYSGTDRELMINLLLLSLLGIAMNPLLFNLGFGGCIILLNLANKYILSIKLFFITCLKIPLMAKRLAV